eukprot:jgi/Bigna1/90018/estExt_fgenesh1_pg.C_600071
MAKLPESMRAISSGPDLSYCGFPIEPASRRTYESKASTHYEGEASVRGTQTKCKDTPLDVDRQRIEFESAEIHASVHWIEYHDEDSGAAYYVDTNTGDSTWERPKSPIFVGPEESRLNPSMGLRGHDSFGTAAPLQEMNWVSSYSDQAPSNQEVQAAKMTTDESEEHATPEPTTMDTVLSMGSLLSSLPSIPEESKIGGSDEENTQSSQRSSAGSTVETTRDGTTRATMEEQRSRVIVQEEARRP